MDFTFYEVPFAAVEDAQTDAELVVRLKAQLHEDSDSLDWSQSGLSGGEARQALLDRFRSDIREGSITSINVTLSQFGEEIDESVVGNEKAISIAISEVDDLLYRLEDEELTDRLWAFDDEVVLLIGE